MSTRGASTASRTKLHPGTDEYLPYPLDRQTGPAGDLGE
jgi:hypothetical protein